MLGDLSSIVTICDNGAAGWLRCGRTGKTSAPSVWVVGTYVGGCNDGTLPWHGVKPMCAPARMPWPESRRLQPELHGHSGYY